MFRLNSKANLVLLIPLTLIVGSFASANTDLNPPGYVFGIVWPILYLLMGITAWRTFEIIKNLFYVQLFLNAIWSWLFFSFHLPLISLIDIWLLIYININIVYKVLKTDKLAGLLYVPYILWLLFASYLNLFIVINN